jgi:hypothetical protein
MTLFRGESDHYIHPMVLFGALDPRFSALDTSLHCVATATFIHHLKQFVLATPE